MIGGFIALIVFGSTIPETPIEESITQQQSSAKYYCQESVKRMLKNPRDAEFASFTDVKFTKIENMRWWVTSYVYATNSFGAVTRSDFTCKVKLIDEEHGMVEDIKMRGL